MIEGRVMLTISNSREECFSRFGFSFDRGGAHLARSMMLDELRLLLQHQSEPSASLEVYQRAILDENCLAKRSSRTRKITLRHLKSLYALNPTVSLFRAMRYFWLRDVDGQPLIAFLVAYSRDSVLRSSAPLILQRSRGSSIVCANMEEYLEETEAGRFSKETLKAASQRVLASWTRAGHLTGHVKKTRTQAVATPGSVALALFMGYLTDARGQNLFETEYAKLLDCSVDRAIELAESASRKGWIVCKRIGSVIEVLFPNLLTAQEQEWVREQS